MQRSRQTRTPLARVALGTLAAIAILATAGGLMNGPESVAASGVTVYIKFPFGFGPATVRIGVGQTVTWVNRDAIAHGVVPTRGGFVGRSSIAPGKSYTARFSRAGTFPYHDSYNILWTGKVVVGSGTTTAATPRPAVRATPKPTPKPTPRPTPKATAKPAAATSPSTSPADAPAASPSESSAAAVGAIAGSGAVPPGAGTADVPSGGGGGNVGLGLLVAALVATGFATGLWVATRRRGPSLAPAASGASPADPAEAVPLAEGPAWPPAQTVSPGPVPPILQPSAAFAPTGYEMPFDIDEDAPLKASAGEGGSAT